MEVEIVPEPDEETRAAILAALAEEEAERQGARSAWADRLLPRLDDGPEV